MSKFELCQALIEQLEAEGFKESHRQGLPRTNTLMIDGCYWFANENSSWLTESEIRFILRIFGCSGLKSVQEAVDQIDLESTSIKPLIEYFSEYDFYITSLRDGYYSEDFLQVGRYVVGGCDDKANK